jgi:uncharacterized membrane protein YedE/YeeE
MASWQSGLLGGVLIGIAATLLLLLNGRIAGVSGITFNVLQRTSRSEAAWRLAFLAGLMGAGGIAMFATGQRAISPAPMAMLILAGLLVGYGSRLGGGCTSGHGVCGIGRMSKRSLVATLLFVAAAMATVFVLRHVAGVA